MENRPVGHSIGDDLSVAIQRFKDSSIWELEDIRGLFIREHQTGNKSISYYSGYSDVDVPKFIATVVKSNILANVTAGLDSLGVFNEVEVIEYMSSEILRYLRSEEINIDNSFARPGPLASALISDLALLLNGSREGSIAYFNEALGIVKESLEKLPDLSVLAMIREFGFISEHPKRLCEVFRQPTMDLKAVEFAIQYQISVFTLEHQNLEGINTCPAGGILRRNVSDMLNPNVTES